MLRIITGSAKNIRLDVPSSARPMMDRPKSAIFSILQDRIPGADVLDLFAGSGAMGLEAMSRGAKNVKFVEITNEGNECIKANIIKCKFDIPSINVIRSDAIKYVLKILHRSYREQKELVESLDPNIDNGKSNLKVVEQFDIIFLCPPHSQINEEGIRLASRLLKEDGVLVAESRHDVKLPEVVGEAKLAEVRNYGLLDIYFYLTK
jgi:16S rRNA (guanine(966)-N(2))-methyltransferase RsmD